MAVFGHWPTKAAGSLSSMLTMRVPVLSKRAEQVSQQNAIPYTPERSGGFVGVDPLADKYPGWGPYVYCLNNPLIYWAPNGEDVYGVNDEGEIMLLLHDEEMEEDILYSMSIDEDGDGGLVLNDTDQDKNSEFNYETDGVSLADGSFDFNKNVEKIDGRETGFQMKDTESAYKAFEFIAKNTKVEFGLIDFKDDKLGALLMTNHNDSKLAMPGTLNKIDRKYPVEASIHNHPKNSPPSDYWKDGKHKGDVGHAQRYSSSGSYIKHGVYAAGTGLYYSYSSTGSQGSVPWDKR